MQIELIGGVTSEISVTIVNFWKPKTRTSKNTESKNW